MNNHSVAAFLYLYDNIEALILSNPYNYEIVIAEDKTHTQNNSLKIHLKNHLQYTRNKQIVVKPYFFSPSTSKV